MRKANIPSHSFTFFSVSLSSAPRYRLSTANVNYLLDMSGSTTEVERAAVKSENVDVKPSPKLLEHFVRKSGAAHRPSYVQDPYINKLCHLKKAIKDTIFLNGTICDEVLRTEEKLSKAKEERRFLLRKLLQYQNITDISLPLTKVESHFSGTKQKGSLPLSHDPSATDANPTAVPAKSSKAVKRKQPPPTAASSVPPVGPPAPAQGAHTVSVASAGPSEAKKKGPPSAKDIFDSLQVRPKKGKGGNRKVIPPLMLDSLGRPVFPMALGDVTLHSIGEIIPDRSSFHCAESIYPVGYCITRVYTSLHRLDTKCLYTCKISDNNDGPLFEIAAEDNSEVIFKGQTPSDCHTQLLRAVNKIRGELLPVEAKGLDFFGLSHPVIQNLVQSCPGARKCSGYKWVKFEINKAETNENVAVGASDPTVGYDAFKAHLALMGGPVVTSDPSSASLRALLTTKGSSSGQAST